MLMLWPWYLQLVNAKCGSGPLRKAFEFRAVRNKELVEILGIRCCCLTSKLNGARRRKPQRSYLILSHRFPPTLNQDHAARPLQRKLALI